MRASSAFSVSFALVAACSPSTRAAPTWDASVDAPHTSIGPIVGSPSLSGGGGTTGGTTRDDCFAQVLVVFDRSTSMAAEWSSGGVSGPRWRVAADALTAALTPLADHLEVGALLFPTSSDESRGECSVVAPIEEQLDYRDGEAFLRDWDALWSSPELRGLTPIDAAFDAADAALAPAHEVTVVILLTDGEPTCTGAITAAEHAASWRARGISTFVVGLPGSGGSSVLGSIASAGGTSAISPDDPDALTSGLSQILRSRVDQACGD